MFVSSALTGLAQVIVMNLDDTIAVETSVGDDGTLVKTPTSPVRDVGELECDSDVADCDVKSDVFWFVLTADFERAIDSPSWLNFFHAFLNLRFWTRFGKNEKEREKKEKETKLIWATHTFLAKTRVTSLWSSVTRWVDLLSIFGHWRQQKLAKKHYIKIGQSMFKISPKLVALLLTQRCKPQKWHDYH